MNTSSVYSEWGREELEEGIIRIKAEIFALQEEIRPKLKKRIAKIKAKLEALGACEDELADDVVATDDEEFEPTKSKLRTRRVAKAERKPEKTGCKKELTVKLPITVEETIT